MRTLFLACTLWTISPALVSPCYAQNIKKLQQATGGTGGIAISGGGTAFTVSLGTFNGLGIGSFTTGLTQVAVSGGQFFYTPYTIAIGGASGGHPALVTAYLSSSFTNSSTVLKLMSCPYPNVCNAYTSYTALNGPGNETTVLPVQTANNNYTAYLGLFVGDVNGGITPSDTAQITFRCYDANNNHLQNSVTLDLSPNLTVTTAIQLQLTAPTGINIASTGSTPDYTGSFGSVNGLGVGAGSGLTIVNGQVSNASFYTAQYTIEPAFSGFSSTTGTINIITSNFAHSSILKLYDSASSGSGYTLILTSAGSAQIASVKNGVNIPRYLGLSVSNINGAGIFTGTDHATLTYIFTVP